MDPYTAITPTVNPVAPMPTPFPPPPDAALPSSSAPTTSASDAAADATDAADEAESGADRRFEDLKKRLNEKAKRRAKVKVLGIDKYRETDRTNSKMRKRMDARISKEKANYYREELENHIRSTMDACVNDAENGRKVHAKLSEENALLQVNVATKEHALQQEQRKYSEACNQYQHLRNENDILKIGHAAAVVAVPKVVQYRGDPSEVSSTTMTTASHQNIKYNITDVKETCAPGSSSRYNDVVVRNDQVFFVPATPSTRRIRMSIEFDVPLTTPEQQQLLQHEQQQQDMIDAFLQHDPQLPSHFALPQSNYKKMDRGDGGAS